MRTGYEKHLCSMRTAVGTGYITAAEYQLITLYIDGLRRSQMPNLLARSERTINSQIRSAKERTGAKTIHQLIAMVAVAESIKGRWRYSNDGSHDNSGLGASTTRA